uniref:Poly [ADP-ribose] polymerase n=1 Tax=Electrophorus electricus TaxID=8005 RepID=A0AAY5EVD2_ELEEL
NHLSWHAAALINRLLCAHDGRMELKDLYFQVSILNLNDEVETVLKDTSMFVTTGDEDKVVVAKTKLRLCRVKDCENCSNLHLCKLYLFGEWCRFCHDLYLGHNVNVLHQHNLMHMDRSELCIILLQNDTTLLPPVCFTYNRGSGEYGNCPDKEACNRLHVCENYIRGICEGTKCSRSHDFYEPHPMKTLQAKGVPSQLMGSLLPAYKNMQVLIDSLFKGIKVTVVFTDRCQKVHFHLPFKWEVRDGNNWKLLPDNEQVERAFCDPTKTYSDGHIPVHFDTMTQGSVKVRRLATPSSVLFPAFILTTSWIWYWEDENGNWIQYGSSRGAHHVSSITSEDLERKYQECSSTTAEFTTDQHSYEINIQGCGGIHLLFILSAIMFMSKNYPIKNTNCVSTVMFSFQRVPLHSISDEYKKIHNLFKQTMSAFNVKSIERVQNRGLWDVFQWQGGVMRKRTAGQENQRLLFHGTESKHTDAICRQNFDWRICGVHGTAYGKGSYFARDAKYSHSYTDKSGMRCMFVCRVLVGEYTTGHSSYLRPPLKDGEDSIFYDSCVDDINNPSIFVIFEKHQVYPEYLIHYNDVHVTTVPAAPKQLAPLLVSRHSPHMSGFKQLSVPFPCRKFANSSKTERPVLKRSSKGFGSMTSLANLSTHNNTVDSFKHQNSRSNLTRLPRQFGSLTSL